MENLNAPNFICPMCKNKGYDMRGYMYQPSQMPHCFQYDAGGYMCKNKNKVRAMDKIKKFLGV